MSICSFAERVAQTRKIPKYYKEALASHVQVGNQSVLVPLGLVHAETCIPRTSGKSKNLKPIHSRPPALASHVQVGNQSDIFRRTSKRGSLHPTYKWEIKESKDGGDWRPPSCIPRTSGKSKDEPQADPRIYFLASHVQVGNQSVSAKASPMRQPLHPTYKWEIKGHQGPRRSLPTRLASHVQVGNQSHGFMSLPPPFTCIPRTSGKSKRRAFALHRRLSSCIPRTSGKSKCRKRRDINRDALASHVQVGNQR